MLAVLRDLCRLLRSWWRVDRIRTPSSAGQLLRLDTGCLLNVAGSWWTVDSRVVGDGARGAFVRYRCRDGETIGWLEVHPPPPFGSGTITWTCGERTMALDSGDIEVFARSA